MSSLHSLAEFLASLIAWFDSKEKGTAVVLFLTALFICLAAPSALRHRFFVSRIRGGITAVNHAIGELSWSPADRLNAVTKTLEGNVVLGTAWNMYRATLRDDPRREGGFVNLVEPHTWFSPERLPSHGYDKWAGTFAGVFLTLGLLFTFVGLSAALFKVGDAGADAVHLREAINGILSVSSAKFITSIAGIIFFIFWTLIARWFVWAQRNVMDRFALSVQSLSTMLTPEVVLVDQLLAAREQTDRMRTLADDVAVAFEAKLRAVVVPPLEAFPEKIDASLRPVVEAIQDMGASIGNDAKQEIQETVREMLEGMSSAAGKEMRSVIDALTSAADELRSAQGNIGSSGDQFGTALGHAAEGITASVTRMTDAVERKLGDLEGRIERVDDAFGRGAISISEISAGMSDATRAALEQALKTISDEAARAAEEARHQSHAHMEPVLAGLRDLVAEIRQTADDGSQYLAHGGRAAADTLVSAAVSLGDRLASASSEASANLAGAAASMTERMDAAVDQFRNIERAVAAHVEHLRRAGETINSAGNSFGVASERLREAAEPVKTTLVSVEVSARHATDALRIATAANDSMREATVRLSEASRSASEVFNSYQSRFEGTDRALGTTIKGLVDGSVELSRRFSEVVVDMDNHLSKAIATLRMGIGDIQSMVTDLSASAADISRAALGARMAAE